MNNKEVKECVIKLNDELRERLLSGDFEVEFCFSERFGDRYELLIAGEKLVLYLQDRHIEFSGGIINPLVLDNHIDAVIKNIKTGGLKQCIKNKKEQIVRLTEEINNLENILK